MIAVRKKQGMNKLKVKETKYNSGYTYFLNDVHGISSMLLDNHYVALLIAQGSKIDSLSEYKKTLVLQQTKE